jgi:hypothetical protein
MNDIKVKLKKFGTIKVNKIVKGHKVGNLWHVLIFGDWHSVPECDVEI